jgi:murein DD-endopeptidase MepM/ murein hydrolase activator NlpD
MRCIKCLLLLVFVSGCASSGPSLSGAPQFRWPTGKASISRGFKASHRRHDGIDIAGKKNTAILAAASGRVLYAGQEFNGYGNLVIIEHRGDTWASFYGHLNRIYVKEGQRVFRGQKIGGYGKNGSSHWRASAF